jgi:hypothetical protein
LPSFANPEVFLSIWLPYILEVIQCLTKAVKKYGQSCIGFSLLNGLISSHLNIAIVKPNILTPFFEILGNYVHVIDESLIFSVLSKKNQSVDAFHIQLVTEYSTSYHAKIKSFIFQEIYNYIKKDDGERLHRILSWFMDPSVISAKGRTTVIQINSILNCFFGRVFQVPRRNRIRFKCIQF